MNEWTTTRTCYTCKEITPLREFRICHKYNGVAAVSWSRECRACRQRRVCRDRARVAVESERLKRKLVDKQVEVEQETREKKIEVLLKMEHKRFTKEVSVTRRRLREMKILVESRGAVTRKTEKALKKRAEVLENAFTEHQANIDRIRRVTR